jgi:hypothetical protein
MASRPPYQWRLEAPEDEAAVRVDLAAEEAAAASGVEVLEVEGSAEVDAEARAVPSVPETGSAAMAHTSETG